MGFYWMKLILLAQDGQIQLRDLLNSSVDFRIACDVELFTT